MFLTRKRQGWSEFNLKFSRKSSHLDSLLFFSDGILQVFWIGIFLHSQQRKSVFQLGFSKATSCVLKKIRCTVLQDLLLRFVKKTGKKVGSYLRCYYIFCFFAKKHAVKMALLYCTYGVQYNVIKFLAFIKKTGKTVALICV